MSNFKFAWRQLFLRPGLSAIVVITLALGIGANAAMFSMFHQVLLRPLPVPEPDRLVNLGSPGPRMGSMSCMGTGPCEYVFSFRAARIPSMEALHYE